VYGAHSLTTLLAESHALEHVPALAPVVEEGDSVSRDCGKDQFMWASSDDKRSEIQPRRESAPVNGLSY
jgi:hypothetical protein